MVCSETQSGTNKAGLWVKYALNIMYDLWLPCVGQYCLFLVKEQIYSFCSPELMPGKRGRAREVWEKEKYENIAQPSNHFSQK